MLSRVFLAGSGTLVLLVFGLPILLVPYDWAAAFGWPAGPQSDLTTYFARCLGALVVALAGYALHASREPGRHVGLFRLIKATGMLLAGVHLWGMAAGAQPAAETVEIAGYLGLALAAHAAEPARAREAA